jgi:outer membrane protein TolC
LKRSFISLVVAALIVGNISGVQAATNDTSNVSGNNSSNSTSNENAINISLANIKDIIIQNNQQAKIYENTRENTKLDYDSKKDAYDTAESDYNTAVSNYNTDLSDYKAALAKYNEDPANNTKPTEPTEPTAPDETALNTAKYALRTANNTYNKNLQGLVETAQTDYISYVLGDLSSKDYDTANVQLLKKAADAAKIQYDMGFLSKNDYTTAQLNYTNALNASNTSNDSEENDKAKLLNDLGLPLGQNITFDTNLGQDLQDVAKINYDNDLTQMFNNNLTLQNDNIDIEQASDNKDNEADTNTDNQNNIIDNTFENTQSKLVLDKNNAEKDFKTKYDALMNSYAAMKSSDDSLQQQKDNYNAAQVSFDYGFGSQQSVDESKVNSLKSSESYQKDEEAFYSNYLSYIEMKEGY